jgi:hypothetical protein
MRASQNLSFVPTCFFPCKPLTQDATTHTRTHTHHTTDIEAGLVNKPGGAQAAAAANKKRKRRRRKPFVWPWNRYDPPMLPPAWLITSVGWFLHTLIGGAVQVECSSPIA